MRQRSIQRPAARSQNNFAKLFAAARLIVISAIFLLPLTAGAPDFSSRIRGDRWLNDVKYLASDDLKGRGSGTPELERAGDYVARQFREARLQPLNGGYFQPFEATVGVDLGPNNILSTDGTQPRTYRVRQDYIPLSFSSKGTYIGPVVFVGYGITAPEHHYDDYSGVDVKGKGVIVLRHEPQEDDAKSVFAGKRMTRHAALYSKAANARNHGAVAMLIVNDPVNHTEDPLIRFGDGGTESAGLMAIQAQRSAAEQWMKQSGRTLAELQKAIDKDLSNHSFLLPDSVKLKMQTDVEQRRRTLKNVAGLLPGSDPQLKDQVIVIGAHYDHLGLGDYDSLAPDKVGQIHHGADDNASGTAGIMELARAFSSDSTPPRRSILFLAFAGEELGLLGSAHYVEQPLIPLERTVAMLNLDMVGRISKSKLFVGGVGTSPKFREVVQEENKAIGFQMDFSDSGYDASDHMSFARKEIPVMFFFSGLHSDYHKPSDTWDKVEPEQAAKLLQLVAGIARRIDSDTDRPAYTKPREDRRYATAHDRGQGGGGYGAYFGSVPDFGESTKGIKFADVREGSPAAKAGLNPGDILIEFDGKPVTNLQDFTYALQGKSPDDEVPVVVLRGDEKVRATVKLGRRE
ncbi:MAG: M28 family peptidase [Acidobacteria bacterium]|nr:M28 family peptidase [Acidobacteriota bacterium]